MSIITRSKFKGIKLNKINHYIRLINENLNTELEESLYWQNSVSILMNFLNENNFTQYEGLNITDKTISNLISRLIKKKELKSINKNNFLPSKDIMTRNKPVIPKLITDVEKLNQMREQSYSKLGDVGVKKKDLGAAINDMTLYRERMANMRPQKREKNNKYGTIGMDSLIKIVSHLQQDIKQIKDAQSVASANEWINRHGFNDLYEARGKDLDGDGIPEVVVQTKNGQKPVIVNGYTTVSSLFPYRNAYYKTFPTVEKRKVAHKQGINLRTFINNTYAPQYDESGRNIVSYQGDGWEDFENSLKAAGIHESQLIKPKKRSTYQSFVSQCISPIYQAVRYLNNEKLPFSLTEMASVIWNQFALLPAMVYVYDEEILNVGEEQWKNLRGKKAVKEAIELIVYEYLVDPVKIGKFVPTVCEMCRISGIPVHQEDETLVANVTIAIIVKGIVALPPDPSNFNEWFAQNVQPEIPALQTTAIIEEPEE